MGILGFAYLDSSIIGSLNPSHLAGISVTRLSAGTALDRFISRDHLHKDISDEFEIRYVALGIPIKNNITLGFRFFPQTRIAYRQKVHKSIGELYFEDYNIGKGGVSIATSVIAAKLKNNVLIAGGLDFIFGNLNTLWGVNFNTSGISDVQFIKNNQLFGIRPEIGFYIPLNSKSTLGLFGALDIDVKVIEEVDYTYADSTSSTDLNLHIPPCIGIGFYYKLSERIGSAFDYMWVGWKKEEQDVGIPDKYQASQFFGLGMELLPISGILLPLYQKLFYRAGISYSTLYYQYPVGETVNDYSASLGLGIPLKHSLSRLDLAFTLGMRGDLSKNDAQELYYSLGFYVNTGEKWFVKKKRY